MTFRMAALTLLLPAIAAPFAIQFNDLPLGTDVLDAYHATTGASFSSGLLIGSLDVYTGTCCSGVFSTNITVTFDDPQPLISFYALASTPLTVEYYLGMDLVGSETLSGGSWWPLGQIVQLDRVVLIPDGEARIDALTNEGLVVPEPSPFWLISSSFLLAAALRRKSACSS